MVPRIRKPYARIDTAGTAGCGTGRGTRPLRGRVEFGRDGVYYMEKVSVIFCMNPQLQLDGK